MDSGLDGLAADISVPGEHGPQRFLVAKGRVWPVRSRTEVELMLAHLRARGGRTDAEDVAVMLETAARSAAKTGTP